MSTTAQTIEVRAPSEQSEGTQSRISRWLKVLGDSVSENEPLIEVETDKVVMEISAPASGVLREILKQEQDEFGPNDILARIDTSRPEVRDAAAEQAAANKNTVSHTAASPFRKTIATEIDANATRAETSPRISPTVKRLLAERGLTADLVPGSGDGGSITVDDVLRYTMEHGTATTAASAKYDNAVPPPQELSSTGRLVPHSTMRRRIAERMVHSLLHTSPHVTSVFEADFSAILAHRAQHRSISGQQSVSLTLTAYIVAACVDAIHAVPETNARWHDDSLELIDTINIGVAAAIENKGLIVPVVHSVEKLDLFRIAQELGRLVASARQDRLAPAEVRGGTFTISNHGVSGSLVATPIVINQPQVAILGIGKLEKRAAVVEQEGEDRIVIRPRCYITLTIDHRAMDGHRANRFLQVLIDRLENWPLNQPSDASAPMAEQ